MLQAVNQVGDLGGSAEPVTWRSRLCGASGDRMDVLWQDENSGQQLRQLRQETTGLSNPAVYRAG